MKKVICIIALLLVASCVVPAVATVDTQSARKSVKSSSEVLLNDKAKAEHICTEDEAQEIIRRFFTEYYGSIDDMAVRDELFRYAEDNEDTHLYIKYLDYAVNCAIELGTTKEDVIINNVEIKDYAVKDGGTVETVAYLSVNYKSSGDADYTSRGELWYISISGETTPKITSLQSSASEFYVPKDLTRKNKDNNIGRKDYTTFDAIDDAYATMISDIAILKELKTKAGTSGIDS